MIWRIKNMNKVIDIFISLIIVIVLIFGIFGACINRLDISMATAMIFVGIAIICILKTK
jgi:hypothetical protein